MADESSNLPAPTGLGMGGLGDFDADALVKATEGQQASKGSATGDALRDAMGTTRPALEVVKVKGHGANLFQFPDESKVDGKDGLLGVVVAFTRHNSYFDKPFGEQEGGELPPCFSNDGATIAAKAESPQSEGGCASCPRNRDARDRAARDVAWDRDRSETCNNYLSLALALPGRDIPVRLRVTRQSFTAWGRYVQDIGTVRGRFLPHEVVTLVTLENKAGPSGEYSVAGFAFKGALPPEMRVGFAQQADQYGAILRRDAESEERDTAASDTGADAIKEAKKRAADAAKNEEAGL